MAAIRVAIAGGGTAGHVNPALAVVPHLAGDKIWIGSQSGKEEPLVRRAGIPFVGVPTGAVVGRRPAALMASGWRNLRGVLMARAILRQFEPDVVLATGGYVSVPTVLAARSLAIPSALFLPDASPGLAVRALSRVADRVAGTAESARRHLPADKVVVTGYPVRPELRAAATRPEARAAGRARLGIAPDDRLLLVVGGSTGARSINRAVAALLPRLLTTTTVLHVTGPANLAEAEARRDALPTDQRARYRVHGYLHEELGAAMAAADLVLCRAGASILGELPAFGLPGVLVPGTFAAGHQRQNAAVLVDAGAAVMADDDRLAEPGYLAGLLEPILGSPERRAAMAEAARQLDRPEAAARIATLLESLAREKIARTTT